MAVVWSCLVGASLSLPAAVLAQVSLGAERYEVTITPPKRPGSESPAATAPAAPGDATTAAGAAAPESATPAAQDGTPAGAAAMNAPRETAVAPPPPSGPLRTFQVGAFRQSKSATSLRDKLAASFAEVTVVEVQSGGEPLYRVYVGRLARGAALEDLKRRLVAAGYPAFEVLAPPASAAD